MSEPFIAEIRIFAGNFAPRGWAFCNGQLLPIAQNTALFSLIGTTYGGDGRTTTALPNMQGRAPMHPGHGPGLTSRTLGQRGGAEDITLSEAQIPSHTHTVRANDTGDEKLPTDHYMEDLWYNKSEEPDGKYGVTATSTGGNQGHNNMQPYLTLSFIIALQGLYPSRG